MNNKNRSHSLILNCIFYSILTAMLLVLSVYKLDISLLNWSVFTFALMSLSFGFAMTFDDTENKKSKALIVFSFGLLLPLAAVIFITTFIISLFKEIFIRKEKEGGDYHDQ